MARIVKPQQYGYFTIVDDERNTCASYDPNGSLINACYISTERMVQDRHVKVLEALRREGHARAVAANIGLKKYRGFIIRSCKAPGSGPNEYRWNAYMGGAVLMADTIREIKNAIDARLGGRYGAA